MKSIIKFLVISIFLLSTTIFSIEPRSSFSIDDDLFADAWCYQDGDYNLRFFTLADGNMWAFKTEGSDYNTFNLRSYCYQENSSTGSYEFNFLENIHDLDLRYDPDYHDYFSDYRFTYPPVAFSVAGVNYVYDYYKNTIPKDVSGYQDYNPYYYQLFIQQNPPTGEWYGQGRVEMQHGPLHSTDPNKPVYRAAHVEGDTVYFVYDSYIYLDTVEKTFPLNDDINTEIHYYDNNALYVDVCTITSEGLVHRVRRNRIDNAMHVSSQHPQHLSGTTIGDQVILFISYDAGYTSDHENKGGGVIVYNASTNTEIDDRYFSTARVLRTLPGSIQGEGETSLVGDSNNGIRFQTFFNNFDDTYPDSARHFVKTYSLIESGSLFSVVAEVSSSRRITGLSNVGDGWGDLMMDVALRTKAFDEIDSIPGNETIRQYLYMFRTDADKTPKGHRFNSDYMTLKFGDSSYIESRDFGPEGTAKYGGMNRQFWSLIGIYEGAPPMPMHWERWQNEYPDKYVTSVSISQETERELTVTSKSELQLYGKVGVTAGLTKTFSVSTSFKQTNDWISSQKVSQSVTSTQDISTRLNSISDGNAVFLWSVPNIARADLSVYPWWASSNDQSIPYSTTVAYWHLAPNPNLVFEEVNMSDSIYAPLFGLNSKGYLKLSSEDSLNGGHPLDSAQLDSLILEKWSLEWTRDNVSRANIQQCASDNSGTPILDLTWSAGGTQSTSSFETSQTECLSEGVKSKLDITIGTKIGLMGIFDVNLEAGSSMSFSNEVSHEFSTSSGFKVGFGTVMSGTTVYSDHIILTDRVQISSYLFNDPNVNYWYHDILDNGIGDSMPEFKTQKPWYLAYVAARPLPALYNSDEKRLSLLSDYSLGNISPNPFNPSTKIAYSIPLSHKLNKIITIQIYDLVGRCINKLNNISQKSGKHSIAWNGINESGKKVASGLYFVKMTAGDLTITKQILMIK